MKTKSLICILITCLITAFIVSSCKSNRRKNTDQTAASDWNTGQMADTSQNSLDWSGVYTAVIPCADCEGIQTTIVLNGDNTYELRTKYLGKSVEEHFLQGSFAWNSAGNTITLSGVNSAPSQYLVGEGRLFQFDMAGNRMPSDVEPQYTLEKVTHVVEKFWRLIELNGNEIPEIEDKEREPHFTLSVENSSVFGHGGCNTFRGTYILQPGNRISFSHMAATMMFCFDNMEMETQLMQVFEMADNYAINEDGILSLNRARMAPLARFVMVYE
jgi:heat shock protein HslJ